MGTSSSAVLRTRCVYGCVGTSHACASKDVHDSWLTEELQRALDTQDAVKIAELINYAPVLKDRELQFTGEQYPMTALSLALNRRDTKLIRALLDAGVSPNLPISEQQRAVYAHRSQLAALNGGDPDLQNLVPNTHFQALCCSTHKDLFMLLLESSANPNHGLIQVCHCGDLEMLEALTCRGAEPNSWLHETTPLVTAVKSRMRPYEKVLVLLRAGADPNFSGPQQVPGAPLRAFYPPLTIATRKRDYRMVRILLEAGADANLFAGDEGLPTVLFWATYWGELELMKLFLTLSKGPLDLGVHKYTSETVFDVAHNSMNFATMRKPRHIAKLPLPSRPPVVYQKIIQMLEEYRTKYPDSFPTANPGSTSAHSSIFTGSTTATAGEDKGRLVHSSGRCTG